MSINNLTGEERIPQRFLNVNDACEYTTLCKSYIYKKVKEKSIPHLTNGSRIVFDREAIDVWMMNGGNMPSELPNINNL